MNKQSLYKTVAITFGILLILTCNLSNARQPGGNFGGKRKEGEMKHHEKEKIREELKGRKDAIHKKHEQMKEKREQKREELQHGAQQRIDARQAIQMKRIEHGIKHGYLTPQEVAKLETQQKSIANMEENALADDKLTREEWAELRQALNEASRCIWAEKHDAEGNQMPAYVMGKNVFAKDDLTAKLQNENLDKETAKVLIKDFKRLLELKQKLSNDELSDAERAALQNEYNDLLNLYFETR